MADQMKFAVTPAQVEAAKSRLTEAGFPLAGDAGLLEKGGYRFAYSVRNGMLTLELLAKPRLVPIMAVRAKIRSVLGREGISEVG